MKLHTLLQPLIVLILLTYNASAQAPYQLKSAKIEYVFDLGFAQGTKTLVFTDSGRVEKVVGRQVIDTSMNAILPPGFRLTKAEIINIFIMQTKDFVYSINLDSMVGSKRPRLTIEIDTSFFKSPEKFVGEDIFLGRKCEVWEFGPIMKIWKWKGIVLKKETEADSKKITEYAISIDENYILKPDEFTVPPGVKIKEAQF